MVPVYALIAAPLARPLRVPLLLWFTQQGSGPLLNAAARVVDAILTVDVRSVPLRSPKVRAIGHGIDVDALRCVPERVHPSGACSGSAAMRRSRAGRRSCARCRSCPRRRSCSTARHRRTPAARTARDSRARPGAGRRGRVVFGDEVAYAEVPHLFELADAVVNATHGNAADKVVYEAAASCLPGVRRIAGLRRAAAGAAPFPRRLSGSLAERIRGYGGGAGPELRAHVVAEHSAGHWADRVLEVAGA